MNGSPSFARGRRFPHSTSSHGLQGTSEIPAEIQLHGFTAPRFARALKTIEIDAVEKSEASGGARAQAEVKLNDVMEAGSSDGRRFKMAMQRGMRFLRRLWQVIFNVTSIGIGGSREQASNGSWTVQNATAAYGVTVSVLHNYYSEQILGDDKATRINFFPVGIVSVEKHGKEMGHS